MIHILRTLYSCLLNMMCLESRVQAMMRVKKCAKYTFLQPSKELVIFLAYVKTISNLGKITAHTHLYSNLADYYFQALNHVLF